MSGIAGIVHTGEGPRVGGMLDKLAHRGQAGREIIELEEATLGVVWPVSQVKPSGHWRQGKAVRDAAGPWHEAKAQVQDGRLVLSRDPLGVAQLYFGRTSEGGLCFASEVKALLGVAMDIRELLPGHRYDGERMERYFQLTNQPLLEDRPDGIAKELRRRLAASVEERIRSDDMGSWLSGGLDSSAMAALAGPLVKKLHTFAAGVPGAPDLEYAREVARFIRSEHREVVVGFDDMLAVLPEVIYHLESFDALLVRSSITNYLVAKLASGYVSDVFSGEGGDELFAGYEYLKSLAPGMLSDELLDIMNRLHNTAFQRVDRCASAHGTVAHIAFADPEVVDYALRIPVGFKLRDGVEKWILRRAMNGALPERALSRAKAKFWEGAGVGELLSQYADQRITEGDFRRERALPNGWILNTKEELFYYRIFAEHFGGLEDLSWMGRTKGAPRRADAPSAGDVKR